MTNKKAMPIVLMIVEDRGWDEWEKSNTEGRE